VKLTPPANVVDEIDHKSYLNRLTGIKITLWNELKQLKSSIM